MALMRERYLASQVLCTAEGMPCVVDEGCIVTDSRLLHVTKRVQIEL